MRGGTRAHAAKGEELHFLWRTLEGNIIIRSIFFHFLCFPGVPGNHRTKQGSSAAEPANDCIPTALLRGFRMSAVKMTEGSVQVESCCAPLFYRKSEPSTGDARMSVLLLHGIRFSSENWLSIGSLETLAKAGCCAVAIDLPELGRSKSAKAPAAVGELAPAGFLKEVCEKLNLVPVVVISPSLSGMYSLPFLLEYQALVRAYIPVAPICTEKFTAEQYQSVKVPTLIVYGDQDTQLGEVSLRNLMNLADHSVVVMKGAGHPCYLDDPDTWHKVLTDFLNRL